MVRSTSESGVYRYMAEWIELWDFEAMTSYNREIGVRGPVGTSRLEFFYPGFTPTVFLQSALAQKVKTLPNSKFVRPGCGLTCGHPFPHHRVGSNLQKALSLRPPLAEVSSRCKKKRFRPGIRFYISDLECNGKLKFRR